MDTKLIVNLLATDMEEDIHIAWSMVNNDDDLFEFCWIVSCLYNISLMFMYTVLDVLDIRKNRRKMKNIFLETNSILNSEHFYDIEDILNDFK